MRYLMAVLAFLTCPCHLPLWMVLLGGTAAGAALTEHPALAFGALTVAFAGSAWVALRLFVRERRR